MRENLKELGSQVRQHFRGSFVRNGLKSTNYVDIAGNLRYKPTMLLVNVEVQGENNWDSVTDHLWLNLGKQMLKYGWFKEGDVVEFDGRVHMYSSKKGNDYHIERPTKVKVFREGEELKITDALDDYTPANIEAEIWSQNRDYYAARDELQKFFRIENYYALKAKWTALEAYMTINSEVISRQLFSERYFDHKEILRLYNMYLDGSVNVEQVIYNGAVCDKNKLGKLEMDEQIKIYKEEKRAARQYNEEKWLMELH